MISPLLRFGTSTWTYEGWKGDVYKREYRKGRFKQDCLAEYATYEYHGERLFGPWVLTLPSTGHRPFGNFNITPVLFLRIFRLAPKSGKRSQCRSMPLAFA